MRDTELYQRILRLAHPGSVGRVELNVPERRVDVWVEHPRGAEGSCPRCPVRLACDDPAEERIWRHLDTCPFQTPLHARIPRVRCPDPGVLNVSIPWAEAHSRFTLLMERLIIDVLGACSTLDRPLPVKGSTVTGACERVGVSWDEAFKVMRRAVARGQHRKENLPIRYMGVDEKAFRKGHSHRTGVCDLERSTVEYVGEERTAESLNGFYGSEVPGATGWPLGGGYG